MDKFSLHISLKGMYCIHISSLSLIAICKCMQYLFFYLQFFIWTCNFIFKWNCLLWSFHLHDHWGLSSSENHLHHIFFNDPIQIWSLLNSLNIYYDEWRNIYTFYILVMWWHFFSCIQIVDIKTGSEVPLIEAPLAPKISGLNSSTSYSMQ